MDIIKTLCDELNIRKEQAENTIKLLDEGNTIAFIARYRKEVTGSLDDKTLRAFFDRLTYLRSFVERNCRCVSSRTGAFLVFICHCGNVCVFTAA